MTLVWPEGRKEKRKKEKERKNEEMRERKKRGERKMKVFRVCRVLNPDYKVFSIFEEFSLKSEIYVSLKKIKKNLSPCYEIYGYYIFKC